MYSAWANFICGLIEVFVDQIYWLIYLAASLVFGVTLLVRWNVLQIKD